MNKIINAGEVFKLTDLLPYEDGKIAKMDLINEDEVEFLLMSFDKDTELTEHSAPGEALFFALEGKGIIGYEGEEHHIKAGEVFKFDKGAIHYVKAPEKFKMGLLLIL